MGCHLFEFPGPDQRNIDWAPRIFYFRTDPAGLGQATDPVIVG